MFRFLQVFKVKCQVNDCHLRNLSNFKNSNISEEIISNLTKLVSSKNISTADSVREQHGQDESSHPVSPPDVVIKPESVEQVSGVVKLCNKSRIPVIPFGAGSGFEGGVVAINGGVCLDMSQMNQVLKVNAEDFDATVQPGVSRKVLNTYLRDTGLWFPVDPGADASLGGMASTSASGTNAVRYGTMRENVLNLQVVLPDGTVMYTSGKGKRARKTSAGYNLTNLFVGSEGTLGVITEVTLRLYAIPQAISAAVCSFPSVRNAVESAIQTLQANIPVARIELLDASAMNACNKYNKFSYKEVPTLFLEFHGSDYQLEAQAKAVEEIVTANGGSEFQWTKDNDERNKLWQARHNLFYAVLALRPGCRILSSDACVPLSNLPDLVVQTKEDIEKNKIIGPVLGHVGDGNFHAFMLHDPKVPKELETIHEIVDRLAERAIAMHGTCTGEHGIGLGKRHFLEKEIGFEGAQAMKNIKTAIDPHNIMNPGKVFD